MGGCRLFTYTMLNTTHLWQNIRPVRIKKVYISGFIGFTVSSLFCGISVNISMLIVFRIIEALSGSMMMATGSAIVTNSVLPENRGKALSVTSIAVAVATLRRPLHLVVFWPPVLDGVVSFLLISLLE